MQDLYQCPITKQVFKYHETLKTQSSHENLVKMLKSIDPNKVSFLCEKIQNSADDSMEYSHDGIKQNNSKSVSLNKSIKN